MATKTDNFHYQVAIFPSLFTNGVRLQMHREDWFIEYARDFFNKHWKQESKYKARDLVFLLEGAYFALDQPHTEFLHPIIL